MRELFLLFSRIQFSVSINKLEYLTSSTISNAFHIQQLRSILYYVIVTKEKIVTKYYSY